MIIRTAQLSLITKEFDKTRDNVESILKRHRGYIGELKVGGSTGSGRTLTGTLRVPADQLDRIQKYLNPTDTNPKLNKLTGGEWQRTLGKAKEEAQAFAQKICDEFDVLYAEGAVHGRVMNIAVHPFIMGQPHRIDALARALDYIAQHPHVWWASGSQITQHYRQHQDAKAG